MASLSTWDLGGCNCGCVCWPCALPEGNLTLTYVLPFGGMGTTAMVYQGGCYWKTGCIPDGARSDIFEIWCNYNAPPSGCALYRITFYPNGTCTPGIGTIINYVDNPSSPSHCSGSAGSYVGPLAWSCSPLSITMNLGGGHSLVITP